MKGSFGNGRFAWPELRMIGRQAVMCKPGVMLAADLKIDVVWHSVPVLKSKQV
jgi:hypothetical protein